MPVAKSKLKDQSTTRGDGSPMMSQQLYLRNLGLHLRNWSAFNTRCSAVSRFPTLLTDVFVPAVWWSFAPGATVESVAGFVRTVDGRFAGLELNTAGEHNCGVDVSMAILVEK